MSKTSIHATELRKHLFEVLDQIQNPAHPYRLITKEGEVKAVLLSNDEWESWQETLEVLSDRGLMKGIQEGLADIQKGRTYSFKDVFGHQPRISKKN